MCEGRLKAGTARVDRRETARIWTPAKHPGAIPTWPAARDVAERRALLRELLTRWRSRINRKESGPARLSSGNTSGLRPRDLAELAGVSSRWYEALERGSVDRRFSIAFISRLADVLRLDERERAALYRLSIPEVAAAIDYFEGVARRRV